MRCVLYAHDMEPITVIDLPVWCIDHLKRFRCVRVAVEMEPQYTESDAGAPTQSYIKAVDIVGERLVRRNVETLMLFTSDEENALLLKAAFLPGQYHELYRVERQKFAEGFLEALKRVGL